ncbi:MAG: hypothetical protein ACTTKH_00555, partial [Treponema sp.]
MCKKTLLISIFFLIIVQFSSFALVLETELDMSNFGLQNNGEYRTIPDFGGSVSLEEQILPHFKVKLAFERDAEIGNSVWAKLTYESSILDVSLGPSLGLLNSATSLENAWSSFSPGIIMDIHLRTSLGFFAGFSGTFAVATIGVTEAHAYLQSAGVDIGYRFPNLLASLRISHRGRVGIVDGNRSFFSITDYGLYTETFSKPSRLKIPINIIFRHIKYSSKKTNEEQKNYGNILFETGFHLTLSNEIDFTVLCGASIYSFTLGE